MSLSLGNTTIGEIYLGSTKIASAFLGDTCVYKSGFVPSTDPYLIFSFAQNINPTTNNKLKNLGEWRKIPNAVDNEWEFASLAYPDQYGVYNGWQCLFSNSDGTTPKMVYSEIGTVSIVGWGNLSTIETIDRLFYNCDAIVSIDNLFGQGGFVDGVLQDCAAAFNGCTGLDSTKELALYNSISSWTNIPPNHSNTFANTNQVAMAQIPIAWGGTLASEGVYLKNTQVTTSNARWCWHIDDLSGLDMSTLSSVEIYTSASVSQYAGVNRRKSNIKWASGTTANRDNPIYYYPCFATISNSAATTPPTAIQHAFITTNYNGILTGSTTAGDMPGTLDPATIGPLCVEIGTYDSNYANNYCFGFLVTQTEPSGMSALTSLNYNDCHFGFLNNSYFSAHAPLFYNPDTLVEKV